MSKNVSKYTVFVVGFAPGSVDFLLAFRVGICLHLVVILKSSVDLVLILKCLFNNMFSRDLP